MKKSNTGGISSFKVKSFSEFKKSRDFTFRRIDEIEKKLDDIKSEIEDIKNKELKLKELKEELRKLEKGY